MVEKGERWGSKRRFGVGPVPWIKQYFNQADAMLASLAHAADNFEAGTHIATANAGPEQANPLSYSHS